MSAMLLLFVCLILGTLVARFAKPPAGIVPGINWWVLNVALPALVLELIPEGEVRSAAVVSGGGDVADLRRRLAAVRPARAAAGLVAAAHRRADPGVRAGQYRVHGLSADRGAARQAGSGAGGGGRSARCVSGAGFGRHRGGLDLFRTHAAAAPDRAPHRSRFRLSSRWWSASSPACAAAGRAVERRVCADRRHADAAGAVLGRLQFKFHPGQRQLGAASWGWAGNCCWRRCCAGRWVCGRRRRAGADRRRAAGGDGADGVGGDPGRRVRPGAGTGQYRAGRRHRAVVAHDPAGQSAAWAADVGALASGRAALD